MLITKASPELILQCKHVKHEMMKFKHVKHEMMKFKHVKHEMMKFKHAKILICDDAV